MHDIDLKAIDLNLLVVLDVLLEERSVSKAAKRIGRTQSATSHALARLRDALGDPLLVRVGSDMQPTPRAERLEVELRRALQTMRRVLEGEVSFDPTKTKRVFSLAGPDFLAAHAEKIMHGLIDVAPHAGFELAVPRPRMFEDLVDGRLDLVVSPPRRPQPEGVESTALVELPWVVFARRRHPGRTRWGARAWTRYPHVQIRTGHERSPVDVALRRLGRTRTVAAWLPSFHAAAALVARTDLLFTAPQAVLGDLADRFDLATLKCPLELAPIRLDVHRATHLSRDPAVRFFEAAVTASLGPALAVRP